MNKVKTEGNTYGKLRNFIRMNSSQVSIFVAVALFFILIAIISPYFLTATNMRNLCMSMATYGVLAAGLTVCMLLGGLDLSQMPVMALCSMTIGLLYANGYSIWLCLLCSLLIGAVAGGINGFIVTKMKIIPMIATIGTQMSFRAVASLTTGGNKIRVSSDVLDYLAFSTFLGIPIEFWIMLLM